MLLKITTIKDRRITLSLIQGLYVVKVFDDKDRNNVNIDIYKTRDLEDAELHFAAREREAKAGANPAGK